VKLKLPAAAGVPLIVPFVAFVNDKPLGKLPLVDHVYDPVPPPAAKFCEYGTPTVQDGNDAVVIVSPVLIVIDTDFVSVAPTLSVATSVKFDVPAVVGVPLIPLLVKFSPFGKLPPVVDHVIDPVPPLAVSAWE
jgi:hypothetical protein